MILTSVYGFNNMPRSFYLMGYGAIPFFLLSAVVFFVPFAFMVAEYGSAFKDEKGGIFSWMQICVGKKYAFVATFMWYTSYVIWLVNTDTWDSRCSLYHCSYIFWKQRIEKYPESSINRRNCMYVFKCDADWRCTFGIDWK